MHRKLGSLFLATSLFAALGFGSTGCLVRTRDNHQHYNSGRRGPPPPPPRRGHDHGRGRGNDRCRWERC